MQDSKVLIVGATGFVGKNLVPQMATHGPTTILVRATSNTALFEENPNIRILKGDLETANGLREALNDIDVVIHCAARTMGRTYWEYYRTNTMGTANLLKEMKAAGVKKILFLSSHAACGPSADITTTVKNGAEDPISFYGSTKRLAEELIIRSGLSYTIIRPVSVYGPHDTEILTYIKLLNRGICPVVGFGPKYLNLIYVTDLVDMIIEVVRRDHFKDRIYFANDGNCYSFDSVLEIIACALDRKNVKIHIPVSIAMFIGLMNDVFVPPRFRLVTRDKVRELACKYWVCGETQSIQEMGLQPKYTFEHGIIETVEWYRKHGFLS
ncbi:MAG: NAD-dependent epimerase/dehydratase family protein [candidate division WOR-3 bacterium]|nr:MAG: NAD-dependent epimerase/dehydratase family protein [candidate division WOR-3 bacterium]